MRRFGLLARTAAGLVVTAMIVLGTVGLGHVHGDAHSHDHASDLCLICRTLASSTATLTTAPQAFALVAADGALRVPNEEGAKAVCVACATSRGPPASTLV
jgi:hypothetical protein